MVDKGTWRLSVQRRRGRLTGGEAAQTIYYEAGFPIRLITVYRIHNAGPDPVRVQSRPTPFLTFAEIRAGCSCDIAGSNLYVRLSDESTNASGTYELVCCQLLPSDSASPGSEVSPATKQRHGKPRR